MIRRVIGCPFGRSRSNSLREISVRVEDFELGNIHKGNRRMPEETDRPAMERSFPVLALPSLTLATREIVSNLRPRKPS